jgi:hypothetical protein
MPLLGSRGSGSARAYGVFGKSPAGLLVFTYTGADQTLNVPADVNSIFVELWGAGGGYSYVNANTGAGTGGYVSGYLDTSIYKDLKLVVGRGGMKPPSAGTFASGDGGGYAGIFKTSVSFANALVIAGGGGGAGGSSSSDAGGGGGGGGLTGLDGQSDIRIPTHTAGYGGTQSAGGAKGVDAYGTGTQLAGSQLLGGEGSGATSGGNVTQGRSVWNTQQYGGGGLGGYSPTGVGNYTGGGGGAGYYGGGGGANGYAGGGAGGSSYVANLTSAVNTQGYMGGSGDVNPPNTSRPNYISGVGVGSRSGNGGNALIVVSWT